MIFTLLGPIFHIHGLVVPPLHCRLGHRDAPQMAKTLHQVSQWPRRALYQHGALFLCFRCISLILIKFNGLHIVQSFVVTVSFPCIKATIKEIMS